jgi:hypothetical protein
MEHLRPLLVLHGSHAVLIISMQAVGTECIKKAVPSSIQMVSNLSGHHENTVCTDSPLEMQHYGTPSSPSGVARFSCGAYNKHANSCTECIKKAVPSRIQMVSNVSGHHENTFCTDSPLEMQHYGTPTSPSGVARFSCGAYIKHASSCTECIKKAVPSSIQMVSNLSGHHENTVCTDSPLEMQHYGTPTSPSGVARFSCGAHNKHASGCTNTSRKLFHQVFKWCQTFPGTTEIHFARIHLLKCNIMEHLRPLLVLHGSHAVLIITMQAIAQIHQESCFIKY